MSEELNKFAVLIDMENISPKYIDLIMDEASNYGRITIKRAYGDFTAAQSESWNRVLSDNSITPIHQPKNSVGKNSSDIALIIDAMKILFQDNVDGFCLVSSDSDFTRLATTIREDGKIVVGMGESKTPSSLIKACDYFKMLDALYKEANAEKTGQRPEEGPLPGPAETEKDSNITPQSTIEKAIRQIILESDSDDGKNLATLGHMLRQRYPDFDSRHYGAAKLSSFLNRFPWITIHKVKGVAYANIKTPEPKKERRK